MIRNALAESDRGRDRATFLGSLTLPACLALLTCLLTLTGCGSLVANGDLKPAEEPVTEKELNAFLSIVADIPGKTLPPMPSIALAAPAWNPHRTLPVKELTSKQFQELDARFTIEVIVKQIKGTRGLNRALRKENWTIERFASFVVPLAAALNKSAASEEELAQILDRSTGPLKSLSEDIRVFASLTDEQVFIVLDKARWIPLVHRARWLNTVPPDTLALVQARRDDLKKVFSAQLLEDPIAPLRHVLRDEGIPFQEFPESGLDAQISWPLQ